eukprot:6211734-Pleurochrysis_carterae.AAC.5
MQNYTGWPSRAKLDLSASLKQLESAARSGALGVLTGGNGSAMADDAPARSDTVTDARALSPLNHERHAAARARRRDQRDYMSPIH